MTRGMAMFLTLFVLAFALLASWYSGQRTDYFPVQLETTDGDCVRSDGHVERQPVMYDGEAEWYSGALSGLHEPSLYRRPTATPRSIRFTWLRSFHDPVVIRIDAMPDGRQRLTAKQGSAVAVSGARPGTAQSREQVRLLTPSEAGALEEVLAKNQLFTLPPSGCSLGVDGAVWLVEANDPSRGYHYRKRQSPDTGPERMLGLHLLGLTGWNVDPIY